MRTDRRSFIASIGITSVGALIGPSRASAETGAAIAVRQNGHAVPVPSDFLGLSYETTQLYNADYFAPSHSALIAQYRSIASHGVLRFGGSLSAYSRWKRPGADFSSEKEERAIAAQKNWEWKLLDPTLVGHKDGAITPQALRSLRGFLDATGWRCIYCLNFGSGSIARAVDEADHVMRILGPRLLCFQLGNEPDFWAGNPLLRPNPYPFEQFWDEYRAFVGAIREKQPLAPFAGPDVALNLDWMERFAERAHGDALFASGHYYAMGPASDPAMTAEHLLSPRNAKLEQQIAAVMAMTAKTGMRFRMTEGNSCFGGGKPGVSDAYASALWGFDFLLETAAAGYLGADLHGGGTGYYTPIAALPSGPALRPLYYGMQLASHFVGARLSRCALPGSINASAWFGVCRGRRMLALVNKSAAPLAFAAQAVLGAARSEALLLHAPSLDDKTNTAITPIPIDPRSPVVVPPYSAMLLDGA